MQRLPGLSLIIIVISTSFCTKATAQKSITLTDELQQLSNISLLPQYRTNSYVAETSTYDRTGGNNDGFAGTYSYLRRNADSSLVMFDVTGAGVINRIATPTPTDDTLDFYIDDTAKVAFSVKYSDLFSGKVYPFVQPLCGNQLGGFYCYYPVMFNKGCKIVSRGKHLQFHQVQYRLYTPGTVAESFTGRLNNDEQQALQKVAALWNNEHKNISDFGAGSLKAETTLTINPGETKTLFTQTEGGRIDGIEFNGADIFAGPDKDVDIKITWDDDATPAVYCPAADFFGYAFGTPSMQSLLTGVKNNVAYCYYPMPFDKKATVQLVYRNNNKNQSPKNIHAIIYFTHNKRDAAKEGKFYAAWQGNNMPPEGQPHIFLNTQGKGHYVATILQAQGLYPGMTYFFEGDDSTAVDGDFRIHGTGSEDYFNGGWYALPDRWENKFSLPMYGCLDYSLPFCRTGGYRLYLADKISFEKSIFESIEHGPEGNKVPVSYTSLSFYYCSTAPAGYTKPVNSITGVYMPDTMMLYPQLMHFNIDGEINTKTQWAFNTGGESFIFTVADGSALGMPLEKIPVGHYKLYVDMVKLPQGCEFSVWQRQTQVSGWLPTANTTKERVPQMYVGDIEVTDSQNSITLQFKTSAQGKTFFLNRFILVKK
ncbi:MAG TPA: glycoside hydrolase family 172 protein [Chitinophagaceae bacterium]|nr:glycoside hydrolase family 172 protein [Chitinophagaceae bacterium]